MQDATDDGRFAAHWTTELPAILALALMAGWFVATSWRKWPDPIHDVGAQWYVFWRLSQGATLYHDVIWNYGPLSAWFDAGLFRWFGTGMMVLVTANLAVYSAIVVLAYLAFRKAWGRLGAFASLAVFISVFSFSRLNGVANYNYATPYANESTHGMLLLLVLIFVTVWWCHGPSPWPAFLLGLCGGLAAVLKPEFMLAGGLLGVTAFIIRWLQRQRVGVVESLLVAAGVALPTLVFTLGFARRESLGAAFVDASQAWWLVLVERRQVGIHLQQTFLGIDRPWHNALNELTATGRALGAIGAIWAAGWIANRPWKFIIKGALIVAAGYLVYHFRPAGPPAGAWDQDTCWHYVGECFPGLLLLMFLLLVLRAASQLHRTGRVETDTTMALALTISAGAMLARMALLPLIDHLGFYQAALAGMVASAFLVVEIPRWTGSGWGRGLATAGSLASIAIGCVLIAKMSYAIHAGQTVPLGEGRDRFYADAPDIDETGSLVNWTVDYLRAVPPKATVFVLPEGEMINYLTRRINPIVDAGNEHDNVAQMRRTPPDYVILVPRNLAELGLEHYGAPGEHGYTTVKWLQTNYLVIAGQGGNPLDSQSPSKGVRILRHDPVAATALASPKPAAPPAGK